MPVLEANGDAIIYPAELIERWRGDEEILRAYGQGGPADILQKCREDLESWSHERKLDELTLTEAAEYSRLSYSTIQRKIASGKLRNVGEKNRPRIYRGDLPKRSEPVPTTETGEPDLAEMILRRRMSPGQAVPKEPDEGHRGILFQMLPACCGSLPRLEPETVETDEVIKCLLVAP